MAVSDRKNKSWLLSVLLTTAMAFPYMASGNQARAQDTAASLGVDAPDDAKMLLAADELIYNRDAQNVTAVGGVQINYNGYQMVAQRVDYNQNTGRVMAIGNIELIEPDGNRIYADSLDITDDFSQGFINSIRVETLDNTRFAAESGERVGGRDVIMNNGVYTACLPCADRPERPPLWQIKAERIIQNGEARTIRLENARFELFGNTVAFLPVAVVPDHTVKRKSGFLFPRMSMSQNLGFGVTVPYYLVLSNHADATISATGYTTQGVMLDAEIRRRYQNGMVTFRGAGIKQARPGAFSPGTSDATGDLRGVLASKGDFKINPRWTFGWDAMVQTDNNFAYTYSIEGLRKSTFTNQAYLTGQGERNHFDARAYYFDVQDADSLNASEKAQAVVLPVIDYSYVAPESVAGGELSARMNFTSLSRYKDDILVSGASTRYRGLKGYMSRMTAEAEWARTFNVNGLLLTPMAAVRGDAYGLSITPPAAYAGNVTSDASATRYMLTAGLEARYPVLMTTPNSSHIIEPIAQIYARNDEQLAGRLPNEDAQSFVFDTSTLFSRDKFSGYDRVEGGTRANVGFRYTGAFDNGFGVNAIFGQSFHLAGLNSFSTPDLVNAGANSGLESKKSDYVGGAGLMTPYGFSVAANARLDEKTLAVKQTNAMVGYSNKRLTSNLVYTKIAPQPDYAFQTDSNEIQSSSSLKLNDNWAVFGSLTYDIDNELISKHGVGLSYGDECTALTLSYSRVADANNQNANDWSINAVLTFRTLGDIRVGSADLETN